MRVTRQESRKRRREIWASLVIALVLVALFGLEYLLSRQHSSVTVGQSVLLFALININLLLLLVLIFFAFRNVAKIFFEKSSVQTGAPLRKKLVVAFTLFATVPTLLLSATSAYYVYQSFERWFSDRIVDSFQKSLQVTQAFYEETNRQAEHWARKILRDVDVDPDRWQSGNEAELIAELQKKMSDSNVDWVQIQVGLPPRTFSVWKTGFEAKTTFGLTQQEVDDVREKGVSSLLSIVEGGELTRVTVGSRGSRDLPGGALVSVGHVIPMLISEKTDTIAFNLEDYKKLLPIQKTVKATFLMTISGMVLLILFFSSWLGFYISGRLMKPLEDLTEATKDVAEGQFKPIEVDESFREYSILINSFNDMAERVREAQTRLEAANAQLVETNRYLDHDKSFLEILVKSVDFGVLAVDDEGQLSIVNASFLALMDTKSLPQPYGELKEQLSTRFPYFARRLEEMLTTRSFRRCNLEESLNFQGSFRTYQITGVPLWTRNKTFSGMVFIFEDLTQLQSVQKSLAWKEVARRLAHEFKNPLTPIRLSAERLQRQAGALTPEKIESATRAIVASVDQLIQLVDEFSRYSSLPEVTFEQASFAETILNTVEIYREAHPRIRFQVTVDPNLPKFLFDPKQMGRAMGNLIKNAVEALVRAEQPTIEVSCSYYPRLAGVTVVISDNGPGMPDDVARRLFEPYFSTRDQGTGLGLTIVHRIIQDHQGMIRVQRNTPHGTRFVIDLPTRGLSVSRREGTVALS